MKILITDKMADEAIDVLKDAGYDVTVDEMDADKLLNEIHKYDGLMVRSRTKATTEVVKAGSEGNLKVIGRAGVGVDNIDIETAAKNGIKVVNSPTGSTESVAELTFAHMLAIARYVPKSDSSLRKGEWIKKQLKGFELKDKTLGLIGSGNISRYITKVAKAFGMKVFVYSPHCTDQKAKDMGATRKSLENLLKESDFVSLHIPHTKDSHYLINKKTISLMKPSSYLINCSRGGIVEEEALFNALKDKKIAGASVDVFEKEPADPKNKLFQFENVVFSPHLGANTKEAQIRAGTICAEQMIKVLSNKEPDFWVNKKMM